MGPGFGLRELSPDPLPHPVDKMKYRIKKIRSCFFKVDKSETVNCVSASALAPHIEASIKGHQ
jgi:hypothetical protein